MEPKNGFQMEQLHRKLQDNQAPNPPSRKLNHDDKKYEGSNEFRHEDSNPELPLRLFHGGCQVKEAVLHYTMSDLLPVNETLSRCDSTIPIIKRALPTHYPTEKNPKECFCITNDYVPRKKKKVCTVKGMLPPKRVSMGASTTRPSLR